MQGERGGRGEEEQLGKGSGGERQRPEGRGEDHTVELPVCVEQGRVLAIS